MRSLDPHVDAFLEAAPTTHDWATANCCHLISEYVLFRTGSDPAADLHGAFQDEAGARAAVAREGDIIQMLDRRLQAVGLRRLRLLPTRAGDLGLVLMPTKTGLEPIGAISLGRGRWAVRTPTGLRFTRGYAVVRWRLP